MKKSFKALVSFTFLLLGVAHGAHLAPAMFIFGDSTVDSGNNNFIPTKAKANPKDYGQDFPAGFTGRFTNGRTWTDYIDEFLGLSYQPPVLDPNVTEAQMLQGLNFASASSGILNATGIRLVGTNLNLTTQIALFSESLGNHLKSHFTSDADLTTFLSKSIFVISVGANDISPELRPVDATPDKEAYNQYVADNLGDRIKDLYALGARKFVVSNVGPLGCSPLTMLNHKVNKCIEELNAMATSYNKKLAAKLQDLGSSLQGSFFVSANGYDLTMDVLANFTQYGFKQVFCMPNETSCDRKSSIFWDGIHTTDMANKIFSTRCFNGTGTCYPVNIQQLASK